MFLHIKCNMGLKPLPQNTWTQIQMHKDSKKSAMGIFFNILYDIHMKHDIFIYLLLTRGTVVFLFSIVFCREYVFGTQDSGFVYLRNLPRRPLWSRSQPKPRVVCAVLDRGHVAETERLAPPVGRRLIQPPQPWVKDSRTNQVLPATAATARTATVRSHMRAA